MAATRRAIGAKPVPKRSTTEIIRTNLLEHPAVKAWAKLLPGRLEPESIEIIREYGKSAVYRLAGVGPGCATVIAKRCQTALIERTIYEEVLPQLSIPGLHYYGFTGEDDEFDWLFLEDAGREEFSPLIAEHRALAARWLGVMHTAAACVAPADHLPDRGPGHYLEHLRLGCDQILRSLANLTLKADDLVVLENIVSQCEVLESCWSQVERFCAGLPRTLVHGDFNEKNLRVRAGRAGIALLPFDWEMAGWGVPAADLAQSARLGRGRFAANPDVATYCSVVREHWPSVDLETIQQLANCGKMFRALAAINWRARSLSYEWVEWIMGHMRIYQAELIDAIQTAGWKA
jgi:hypothetical protein